MSTFTSAGTPCRDSATEQFVETDGSETVAQLDARNLSSYETEAAFYLTGVAVEILKQRSSRVLPGDVKALTTLLTSAASQVHARLRLDATPVHNTPAFLNICRMVNSTLDLTGAKQGLPGTVDGWSEWVAGLVSKTERLCGTSLIAFEDAQQAVLVDEALVALAASIGNAAEQTPPEQTAATTE